MKLLFILLFILILDSCSPFNNTYEFSNSTRKISKFFGKTMGTTYSIKIINIPKNITNIQLNNSIKIVLKKINNKLSNWQKDSEISKINISKVNNWINISDEIYTILNEAIYIHKLSKGALDLTISPLINLWGFGYKQNHNNIPSENEIKLALKNVGLQKLIKIKKKPKQIKKLNINVTLNISSIAKGYAIDIIAKFLEKNGIKEYLIEIGGDLIAKGHNIQNKPWIIGIEEPSIIKHKIKEIFYINNYAMATSGDYRNYTEKNGIRFSHIINPISGRPITHNLASVTVLSKTAMRADAIATMMMVIGSKKGLEIAEKNNIAALFFIHDKINYKRISSSKYTILKNKGKK